MIVTLTIPGDPVPQPRPRTMSSVVRSRTISAPADHRIHGWKLLAQLTMNRAMASQRLRPMTGAVAVEIALVFTRPVRSAHPWPSSGDVDNYAKAALDAANKIIWCDDSQVVDLRVTKRYAGRGETAATHMTVTTVEVRP